MKDRLLEIFKKLEHVFTILIVVSKLEQPRLFGQQPQLPSNTVELARKESAPSVNEETRRTPAIHPGAAALPRRLDVNQNVLPVQLYVGRDFQPCSPRRRIPGGVVVKGEY